MDKNEFKNFCKEEFYKRGFHKVKQYYYRTGKEVLCSLDLQKSNYGELYYINYAFYIGDYQFTKNYPSIYEWDFMGRICVLSKPSVGARQSAPFIEYPLYTADEIRPFVEEAFSKFILPVIENGKEYILEHSDDYFAIDKKKKLAKLKNNQSGSIRGRQSGDGSMIDKNKEL